MSTHRFDPGDRPLPGFTVEAFAGRGGFGEVYLATSDGGREVALKCLEASGGEVELRGVREVMNLKSPHLVTVFDVVTSPTGEAFVVMEFVRGPTLRDLIRDTNGEGLAPAKAAFFLREIARGLTHLHGQGVVHRDLKPANIFYENGLVKIGDYGLSKAMANAGQTQTLTVGTVGYMAPEVGEGRYGKGVDVYALGCLLLEMLTGSLPFTGDTPAEVLMKHLRAEPDLANVPEPFRRVIARALAKDPADRYATPADLVDDCFGDAGVEQSVSSLNPEELSVAAGRVLRRMEKAEPIENPRTVGVALGKGPRSADSDGSSLPIDHREPRDWSGRSPLLPLPLDWLSRELDEMITGLPAPSVRARASGSRSRWMAGLLAVGVACVGASFGAVFEPALPGTLVPAAAATSFAAGALLAAVGRWCCRDQAWWITLAPYLLGLILIAVVVTAIGEAAGRDFLRTVEQALLPTGSSSLRWLSEALFISSLWCLGLANWARPLHPWRARRLSWSLPLLVGGIATVAMTQMGSPLAVLREQVFLTAAATVLVAQLLSPLEPLPQGESS